jgi:hypothetical protein
MTNESEAFKTHLEDQQKAATEHAEKVVEEVSRDMNFFHGGSPDVVEVNDFSYTYVGSKYKWLRNDGQREINLCLHVDMLKPEIMYNAICAPEIVGCMECIRIILSLSRNKYPYNCDFCFKIDTVFCESVFRIGHYMIFGNLCMSCHDKQLESQTVNV